MRQNSPVRPKVFISHTSADHDFVNRLAADLQQDGCDVWLDDVKMHIGDSIPEEVQRAIGEAHFVVAVLSKSSKRRKWVQEELSAALGATVAKGRRHILPCVVDGCRLPALLAHRLHADFRRWREDEASYGRAYRKMIDAIRPVRSDEPPVVTQCALLRSASIELRVQGARALAMMGSKAEAAVPALLQALTDPSPRVRGWAADALGHIGAEVAVGPLTQALDDGSGRVRGQVAEALGRFGSTARPATPKLCEALHDRLYGVRGAAAKALGDIGPTAAQAIPALTQAIGDRHAGVRLRASAALAQIGQPDVPVLRAFLTAVDGAVRLEAAVCLARVPSERRRALDALRKMSRDEETSARYAAVAAMGRIGPPAIAMLREVLYSDDWRLHSPAARSLASMGLPGVRPLVRDLRDRSGVHADRALMALVKIGEVALPALDPLTRDRSEATRVRALIAIRAIRAGGPVTRFEPVGLR